MGSTQRVKSNNTKAAEIKTDVLDAARVLRAWTPNHYNSGVIETMAENASKCYLTSYLPAKTPVHTGVGSTHGYPSFRTLADRMGKAEQSSFRDQLQRVKVIEARLKGGRSVDLSLEEKVFLTEFAELFRGLLTEYIKHAGSA